MSETSPFSNKYKLKNKRRFYFFYNSNDKNVIANFIDSKFKSFSCISFITNIICLLYIFYLKKKLKKCSCNLKNTYLKSNKINDISINDEVPIPVLDYTKDELLKMCYKSRSLYFEEERKKQTSPYLDKYQDFNSETFQNKIII